MLKRFRLFLAIGIVLAIIFLPLIALAQGGEGQEEIRLGQYAIPVLISLFLGIIFNFAPIGDRYKPLIAIGLGLCLGIIAIRYHGQAWTLVVIIDYVLYGIMAGCGAIGLYEGQKALRRSHR